MTMIALAIGLLIGGFLGYQQGTDKRRILEMANAELRASRDSAVTDAQYWRILYERQAGLDQSPDDPEPRN